MTGFRAQIQFLWDKHAMASRSANMRGFVEELVLLAQSAGHIRGFLRQDSICIATLDDGEASFEMTCPSAKGRLRIIIANLVGFAGRNGVAGLDPYGDCATICLRRGDETDLKLRIEFTNTLRDPSFSIQVAS